MWGIQFSIRPYVSQTQSFLLSVGVHNDVNFIFLCMLKSQDWLSLILYSQSLVCISCFTISFWALYHHCNNVTYTPMLEVEVIGHFKANHISVDRLLATGDLKENHDQYILKFGSNCKVRQKKIKAVWVLNQVPRHEDVLGSGSIDPHIFNLGKNCKLRARGFRKRSPIRILTTTNFA